MIFLNRGNLLLYMPAVNNSVFLIHCNQKKASKKSILLAFFVNQKIYPAHHFKTQGFL